MQIAFKYSNEDISESIISMTEDIERAGHPAWIDCRTIACILGDVVEIASVAFSSHACSRSQRAALITASLWRTI